MFISEEDAWQLKNEDKNKRERHIQEEWRRRRMWSKAMKKDTTKYKKN